MPKTLSLVLASSTGGVVKVFLVRMSYYLLAFGFVILVIAPITVPLITNIIAWPYTKHWDTWSEMLDTAIWVFSRGLIVTPFAAFVLTTYEFGMRRGWWK